MTSLEQRTKGYILAVDDETSILHMMKLVVTSFGYEIVTAENGVDAINAYNRMVEEKGRTFDVILTDIQMPLMDGYEFARIIKEHDPRALLIAVSAWKIDRPDLFYTSLHKPYKLSTIEKELEQAMQYTQQTL